MKSCFTLYVIKEFQIKKKVIPLPEWPKSETFTPPNADEDVSNRNSHSVLVGKQNAIVT